MNTISKYGRRRSAFRRHKTVAMTSKQHRRLKYWIVNSDFSAYELSLRFFIDAREIKRLIREYRTD